MDERTEPVQAAEASQSDLVSCSRHTRSSSTNPARDTLMMIITSKVAAPLQLCSVASAAASRWLVATHL